MLNEIKLLSLTITYKLLLNYKKNGFNSINIIFPWRY